MIYVCELLLSVQGGSKLTDQVLRQQRRRSVMRRGDRAQAASGVQNDLSIGTPCQANDQAGHEGISGADRIFDHHFRSKSGR